MVLAQCASSCANLYQQGTIFTQQNYPLPFYLMILITYSSPILLQV